jgi:hypothetical protein
MILLGKGQHSRERNAEQTSFLAVTEIEHGEFSRDTTGKKQNFLPLT